MTCSQSANGSFNVLRESADHTGPYSADQRHGSTSAAVGSARIAVNDNFGEALVGVEMGEEADGDGYSLSSSASGDGGSSSVSSTSLSAVGPCRTKAFWVSFLDGLQRVVIFTQDEGVVDRIKDDSSYSLPLFEVSLSMRALGLSLVDNMKKRELAYIALTQ